MERGGDMGTRTQLVETVRTPFRNVRYRQEGFALLCKVALFSPCKRVSAPLLLIAE